MKTKYILIIFLGVWGLDLFAHDQIVHEAITFNAAESAYAESSAYIDFLNTVASDDFFTAIPQDLEKVLV